MAEIKTFDSLLQVIGIGRWTLLMFAPYMLWAMVLPYFSLGGVFYNPTVDHWCSVPDLQNSSWTKEQRRNYSIPWEDKGGYLERSNCLVLDRDYQAVASLPWSPEFATSPEQAAALPSHRCHHWEYDTSTFASTVTMEWNLVCDRASLSPFFQSFYFFGAAVGEPLIGFLADRYGRRYIVSCGALLFLLTAITSALVPIYALVLTGRFVLGIIHASNGPAYVQGMEACPMKVRTIFGLLATAPFAMTGMLFGAWAYFIRDWQTLQMVCAIPSLLLISISPILHESPRWLMQEGRLEEAADTLLKAARWQGAILPPREDLITLLEKFRLESDQEQQQQQEQHQRHQPPNSKEGRTASCWRESTLLVRTPVMRRVTAGLFGCWFFTGVTYWGIGLSGVSFSSDPFLYMVLGSLVEIPGYTIFTPLVARFGRRSVLAFCFGVCCCAILTAVATPARYTWMIFTLALVGRLFITGVYGLLYLVSSELFPTSVRSRGLNLSSMMARVGSILTPFIVQLLSLVYWWASPVLLGVGAGVGMLFALLLPESKNKPLADTVEQLELLYGSSRNSSASSIEKGPSIPLSDTTTNQEEE